MTRRRLLAGCAVFLAIIVAAATLSLPARAPAEVPTVSISSPSDGADHYFSMAIDVQAYASWWDDPFTGDHTAHWEVKLRCPRVSPPNDIFDVVQGSDVVPEIYQSLWIGEYLDGVDGSDPEDLGVFCVSVTVCGQEEVHQINMGPMMGPGP